MKGERFSTTIGEFSPFTYGKGLPKKIRNRSGDVPVYGSNGVIDYHDTPLTNAPTIIVGRKGTIGAVHFSSVPCWPIDTTFYITSSDFLTLRFKYYMLKSLGLESMNSDSAVPGLNRENAHTLNIVIPSNKQQKYIAYILGKLDDKIEKNRLTNETLEDIARALFKSWFVNFDPVRAKIDGSWQPGKSLPGLPANLYDLFPDRLISSELGEIPEGWMIQPLEYIAQELTKKENPALSPDSIYHHYSLPAYGNDGLPIIETGDKIKSIKTILQPNVVLVSRIDPENNRVWLVDIQPKDQAISSTEFLVLKPKDYFPREYIYCLARSAPFRTQIQSLITGTSHQRAQRTAVMKIQIIVPSNIILRAFETNTSSLLARLLANRRESSMLAKMRDALAPKMLSGEIRVEDLEGVL